MNTNHASRTAKSLTYYEQNASAYIEQTLGIDMAESRERFTSLLSPGARILDLGCGAGRDLAAFARDGFKVIGLEPVRQLAEHARAYSKCVVIEARLEDAAFADEFDGIWACASLLHIPRADLPIVLQELASWARPGGIFLASFKFGSDERVEGNRYFNDMTPEMVRGLVAPSHGWTVGSVWTSADATRTTLQWTNVLARKNSDNIESL